MYNEIPFSQVDCSGNELAYVREVLESGWLTTASKTKSFEEMFSKVIGVDFCFAVNSCTSALHLALEAIGIGSGDKVLLPSMTFTATAEVVRYLGADPIFLDVEYGYTQLSYDIVEQGLKTHHDVKAVIVVDFGGQPAPLMQDLCNKYNVTLVADAAHAFPASINGAMVGTLADITCFSFYANKTITTGEGGMLVTNNKQVADRVRLMRLHGIDRDVWGRFTNKKSPWEYDIKAPGFKYNMPDVNAALGLAQLERAEAMRFRRQEIAQIYFEGLSLTEGIDLPLSRVSPHEHAWHLFPVVLNSKANINRAELMELLGNDGIGLSVHYKPLHRMSYYFKKYNLDPSLFPNTEKIWKGNFSLPIYSMLEKKSASRVVERIKFHLNSI